VTLGRVLLFDANYHFLSQMKRFPCMEAELEVSVVQNVPLGETILDELSDIFHHDRLGSIGVEKSDHRFEAGLTHGRQLDGTGIGR